MNVRGIMDKVFDLNIKKLLFTHVIVILNESHTSKRFEKYSTIPGFILSTCTWSLWWYRYFITSHLMEGNVLDYNVESCVSVYDLN